MKIKSSKDLFGCPFVTVTQILCKGSEFCFVAKYEYDEEAWEISYTINQLFYPQKLGKGEKVEAVKLLLDIWERFSKFKCICGGATDSHTKTYLKLGFKDEDDWLIFYPESV